MSKKELLPCPFCGSKARLVRIAAGCAAECTGCGVRMMLGSVGVGWYATDGEAAADWNRRQPSALAAPLAHAGQRERVLVEREQLERAASVVAWMSCRSDIKAADMKRLEQCASELSCALAAPPAHPDAPRCQCCGYLVTESEHRGCLRSASPHPDASVLVEALELARRTLAMAGLEGEVTRRIDTALAGKGATK